MNKYLKIKKFRKKFETDCHCFTVGALHPVIKLKDWIDPNYWAGEVGEKSGMYEKARNSKTRKWVDSLKGWKWWAWQIIGGLLFVVVIEFILNKIGMTILPWK